MATGRTREGPRRASRDFSEVPRQPAPSDLRPHGSPPEAAKSKRNLSGVGGGRGGKGESGATPLSELRLKRCLSLCLAPEGPD